MGTTCIIGVDKDPVLKDFIAAHVEYLSGKKVCLDHWYPDFKHEGRTVRYFYATNRLKAKLFKLLPQALYHRIVTQHELDNQSIRDSLAAFFRQHNVDVILAEFGPTGADIAPHARSLGIPLIVHFHGHDAHRTSVVNAYRDRYREMFQYAHTIVSVSRFMTQTLIELGAPPDRVLYNPYGPRDRFFDNVSDYRPTFLSLGRFTDIKANYLTLAAFGKVQNEFPEARLVMAGNGELLEACKTLADRWGLSPFVEFPGAVPHASSSSLFAKACCFVQHSITPSYGDAEGTPVVILEAGAAGLPVVSTRHAGIPDVVVHGETGYLVEERDVDSMAVYMLELVRDQAKCKLLGANARSHIRSNFSMGTHIARLEQAIDAARNGG